MNNNNPTPAGIANTVPARITASITLLIIAGVFLYAGVSKVGDPAAFAHAIELYRVVPRTLAVITALWLPWIEIGCACAIFIRGLRGGALAILTACSVVFTAMIVSALARGLDISCGCFGDGDTGRAALLVSLVRAAILAFVCGAMFLRHAAQTAKSV
ncbi:putative oxidoreductase [Ereboglobus sp. PH5-10]|uniref:MauE/DoxX family redox-associated membrane protein n=1 Tax=Ereboglobus sp. PH5-10 TaxID=2940629 RepID=UPI002406E369|nr:MauE/DoxX family redox-associated membrane protein [Ereboglobus sp. PH5-10]MDF9826237.1 putative oxidoreductase [Ereboglobus sp. PH5-10]